MQCRPCITCFKQEQPLFDLRKSTSFKLLKPRDRLANNFNCFLTACSYFVKYYSRQFSSGVASVENFAFQTNSGVLRSYPLVFGCGVLNHGTFGSANKVSGILGMDKQPFSFARQLGDVMKNRFSYCLPTINAQTKESYLRFGDEAVIRGGKGQSTPFLNGSKATLYQLNLIDISVEGQKLGLPKGTFSSGCVIDSGSSISLLSRTAFTSVTESVDGYFSKSNEIRRYRGRDAPNGFVCYTKPNEVSKLPSMTLNLQGAIFNIPAENLFLVEKTFICLGIAGSRGVTILGAYQQQNVRVVYDLEEDRLSFAPEDCSKDTA